MSIVVSELLLTGLDEIYELAESYMLTSSRVKSRK